MERRPVVRSRGSRPACGARGRDSRPRARCRRNRCHVFDPWCLPFRSPDVPDPLRRRPGGSRVRSCQEAPLLPAATRAGAATVGGSAGLLQSATVRGSPATSRRPGRCARYRATAPTPRRPERHRQRARRPPAASGKAPDQVSRGAAISEFGQSCVLSAHTRLLRRAVSDPDRSLDAYGSRTGPAGK